MAPTFALWDSEQDENFGVVTKAPFEIEIDKENSAIRLLDQEINGTPTTLIGFAGPNAIQNAKTWGRYCAGEHISEEELDEWEGVDLDTSKHIEKAIKACFGLS